MLGLRTTIYKVSNLQEAKKWYASAFKEEAYFDEVFYVGFNIRGYELGLLPESIERKPFADNVLSYWGVDDIEASYQNLLKIGAKEHESPHNVGGEIMVASVFDPWYNVIGIIYNPHFKLST